MGKAQQFEPEVVTLDIGLPGMDGYDVAAATREGPAIPQPKLIALTSKGKRKTVSARLRLGSTSI